MRKPCSRLSMKSNELKCLTLRYLPFAWLGLVLVVAVFMTLF